jgi:hypothetical protein
MRFLFRFGLAALVSFLVSCSIVLASYSLGLWLGRNSDNLMWIIYDSILLALLLGLAAAVQPRRKVDQQGSPILAALVGVALGFLYSLIVARRNFVTLAFFALMLSCWVPSGISAMAVVASGKRISSVVGIVILCLAATFLTEPVFNVVAHNQQLTVVLIAPSEMSTHLEGYPEIYGFGNGDEVQTAEDEALEMVRALGYTEPFRVLSITKQGKGRKSLTVLVLRAAVTKKAVLPVPDKSTVVYIQQSENWEKKPAEAPVLRRGILMEPAVTGDKSLGYFSIPDAQGVSLMGTITRKAPVQSHSSCSA